MYIFKLARQLIYSYDTESLSNMFWGVYRGRGHNNSGVILENIRKDIFDNQDLKKWLLIKFDLE